MQFHRVTETLTASRQRLAVLRATLAQPGKAWTGRAVAREAGVSPRWAIEALREGARIVGAPPRP